MPSVPWYCWLGLVTCKKTVARITYTVLVETLNPAQSINQYRNGLQFLGWQYGSIFIRLSVVGSQIYEISRNSEIIQGHVYWCQSKAHACECLVGVLLTVFEILTHKARKWLVFPTNPRLTPPLGGTPPNFGMKFTKQKLEEWGYRTGENFIILTSTVFDWCTRVTDRRTDGR